jgi:hypothetical protein
MTLITRTKAKSLPSRRAILGAGAAWFLGGRPRAAEVSEWHVSRSTSHGTGGQWRFDGGVISGTQDRPGNGGALLSDESFEDVDVSLEFSIDAGVDSGLFLRSSEKGEAYQVMLDHVPGGSIGGIWGEALFPTLSIPAASTMWDPAGWNALRARIRGQPPRIEVWLNEVKITDFRDTISRRDSGSIGLQVHGGGDLTGKRARFRAVSVTRL